MPLPVVNTSKTRSSFYTTERGHQAVALFFFNLFVIEFKMNHNLFITLDSYYIKPI